jgi:hypothetical protein
LSANLIISLDCEGKWGLSNNSKLTRKFTNSNLIKIYTKLNNFFSSLNIPITYAFVGSFILKKAERVNFECFENINQCYSEPLINYYNSDVNNKKDGWFVPEIYEIVNNKINEISCHSFSHLSFSKYKEKSIIDKEMINCKLVEKYKKIKFKTFVFPYNEIAHLDKIEEYGFNGFRYHKILKRNLITKAKNLFNEWNVWEKVYNQNEYNEKLNLVKIPGGFFFNWRFKWRKYLIPELVTYVKWKNLINYAIQHDKTLNLWFHPHNILTAPSTFNVLKKVILEANRMRDKGKLNIITQASYTKKFYARENY